MCHCICNQLPDTVCRKLIYILSVHPLYRHSHIDLFKDILISCFHLLLNRTFKFPTVNKVCAIRFFAVPFPAKQKRPEHLFLQAFQPFPEQGMRESNSRQRFWRPLSYHLTNPLYIKYYEGTALIYYIHLSFVFQYLFFCTFKTSHRSLPLKPFGQALDRLVAVRSTHCCASTPVLST